MARAPSCDGFRRYGDGSPDFAFYRLRAGRLRRAARADLWRRVRRRTARALASAVSAALRRLRRSGVDAPGARAPYPKPT